MLNKYNGLNFVAVIIMFITTITSLVFLPDTVINHFNGISPDQTGSKYVNLIIPVLGLVLFALGTENLEAKLHVYSSKIINIIFVIFAELNLWWTSMIFKYAHINIPLILWISFGVLIIIICVISAFYFKD